MAASSSSKTIRRPMLLEHVLRGAGHDVDLASTCGRRDPISAAPYDLVVADGKLPDPGPVMAVGDAASAPAVENG